MSILKNVYDRRVIAPKKSDMVCYKMDQRPSEICIYARLNTTLEKYSPQAIFENNTHAIKEVYTRKGGL